MPNSGFYFARAKLYQERKTLERPKEHGFHRRCLFRERVQQSRSLRTRVLVVRRLEQHRGELEVALRERHVGRRSPLVVAHQRIGPSSDQRRGQIRRGLFHGIVVGRDLVQHRASRLLGGFQGVGLLSLQQSCHGPGKRCFVVAAAANPGLHERVEQRRAGAVLHVDVDAWSVKQNRASRAIPV